MHRRLESEANGVEDYTTGVAPTPFTIQEKALLGFLEILPSKAEQFEFYKRNEPDIQRQWSKLSLRTEATPYYLVFSPLDKGYDSEKSKATGLKDLGLWLRKFFGVKQYFATTEVIATKVHHNFIIWWIGDFRALYDAYGNVKNQDIKIVKNKWTMNLTSVNRLTGLYEYITKEKWYRDLTITRDYVAFNGIPEIEKIKAVKNKKLIVLNA